MRLVHTCESLVYEYNDNTNPDLRLKALNTECKTFRIVNTHKLIRYTNMIYCEIEVDVHSSISNESNAKNRHKFAFIIACSSDRKPLSKKIILKSTNSHRRLIVFTPAARGVFWLLINSMSGSRANSLQRFFIYIH